MLGLRRWLKSVRATRVHETGGGASSHCRGLRPAIPPQALRAHRKSHEPPDIAETRAAGYESLRMTWARRKAGAVPGAVSSDVGDVLSTVAAPQLPSAPPGPSEPSETLAGTLNPGGAGPSNEHHDEPSDPSDDRDATTDPEEVPGGFEVALREPPDPVRAVEEREKDWDLVRRAQNGDRQAFRELYERHSKRAYAVAFGVLKNKQDALDVVQESFVRVHRHLDSFQGGSSFYTWFYRIVMNLAIDQLRRYKSARAVEYDDAVAREGDVSCPTILPRMLETNPRSAVIRRELMEWVSRALETLPEYHRQVILLREVEGMSYGEMAEVLDVPKGTIMSRLFHARRKMQAALKDYVEGHELDIEE